MNVEALNIRQPVPTDPDEIKSCCAQLYEHEAVRLLMGSSLHPGGLALTARLGDLLRLGPSSRLLDVAAGNGASAFCLAERTGCHVTGTDLSTSVVASGNERAAAAGEADRISFEKADAEHLPFPDETFDAVMCECAFCLFPDKRAAAAELARVTRPGGGVALSDLTRTGPLPKSLDGLISWIACIGDARPVAETVAWLEEAGLRIEQIEHHNDALRQLIDKVRFKLLGADILAGLGKLDLSRDDLATAKAFASEANAAVASGTLGYAIIVAVKPG